MIVFDVFVFYFYFGSYSAVRIFDPVYSGDSNSSPETDSTGNSEEERWGRIYEAEIERWPVKQYLTSVSLLNKSFVICLNWTVYFYLAKSIGII